MQDAFKKKQKAKITNVLHACTTNIPATALSAWNIIVFSNKQHGHYFCFFFKQ